MSYLDNMIYELFTFWLPWSFIAFCLGLALWLAYIAVKTDSIRK